MGFTLVHKIRGRINHGGDITSAAWIFVFIPYTTVAILSVENHHLIVFDDSIP